MIDLHGLAETLAWIHLNPQALQQYGGFVASLTVIATFVLGRWKASAFAVFFRAQLQLVSDLAAANRRSEVAEGLSRDLARNVDYLRAEVERLQKRITDLEPVRQKFDALVDYTALLQDYDLWLHGEATRAGVDLSEREKPVLPKILMDRFGVPEMLQ